MNKNEKTQLNKAIEMAQEDIANYERILKGYYGRWYDYGQRSLEAKRLHLRELEKKLQNATTQIN